MKNKFNQVKSLLEERKFFYTPTPIKNEGITRGYQEGQAYRLLKENGFYYMKPVIRMMSGNVNKYYDKQDRPIIANGVYIFVILCNEEYTVFCMKPERRCGHISISKGKDIYYAGEIFFNLGKIEYWNNASGHYCPLAEINRSNIHPELRSILPINLFKKFTTGK